ncbi:MAG: hypothetical protein ACJAVR_002573 [Paracoccaceae bacterium]|jgi:hypothetical protein
MPDGGADMPLFRTFSTRAVCTAALVMIGAAYAPASESFVPERRSVVAEDTDFYGGDIGSILGSDFDACQRACLSDRACHAFTYNGPSAACFLKSDVERVIDFEGAISALVVDAPPEALALAQRRATDLNFLPEGYLAQARDLASALGAQHRANKNAAMGDVAAARSAAQRRAARHAARSGEWDMAVAFQSAALNLLDTSQGWTDLSGYYLRSEANQRAARRNAAPTAINGYLRAQAPGQQAAALNQLAMALEQRGQGRAMIVARHLSYDLMPEAKTYMALTLAISRHGFRILAHSVESDAAAPRICVTMSEPLNQTGFDYAPYVRVEGEDLPVETKDRQICVEGVSHGRRYSITLRAGLPAANGETLARSAHLEIAVRDRTPSVRFTGRAYVLPKSGPAAIPVVTVNLDEIAIKIHRVGDRNLMAIIQDGLFDSQLNAYHEDRLRDQLGEEVWTGFGLVERKLNADVTTAIAIGDAIATFEPGAYAMTARTPGEDTRWEDAATQWFWSPIWA